MKLSLGEFLSRHPRLAIALEGDPELTRELLDLCAAQWEEAGFVMGVCGGGALGGNMPMLEKLKEHATRIRDAARDLGAETVNESLARAYLRRSCSVDFSVYELRSAYSPEQIEELSREQLRLIGGAQ